MDLHTVIINFLAAGGLGFITYYIADKEGVLSFRDSQLPLALPFCLTVNVFYYLLFMAIKYVTSDFWLGTLISSWVGSWFSSSWFSLVITIVLVYVISVRGCKIKKRLNANKGLVMGYVWNDFFNTNSDSLIYIYNLDGKLLDYGVLSLPSSDIKDECALTLWQAQTKKNLCKMNFDEIQDFMNKKDNQSKYAFEQYLNFDKNIKMVAIKEMNN